MSATTPTDIESTSQVPTSKDTETKTLKPNSSIVHALVALAIISLIWGAVMTGLYIEHFKSTSAIIAALETKDTTIRTDGTLGIAAISHINVIVNDDIDVGAKYYEEVLGFVPATNTDGPMHYTNITNNGFCVDAGFETCRVDIIFLKHEVTNLYLELFFYYEPSGNKKISLFNTNDAGGVRHIALEVSDAVDTYNKLKASNHQGTFITKDTPIPLDPFPYTFFYWIDRYGVQWEFEQGRPVEYGHIAGITG